MPEQLDNDHAAGAARTGMRERLIVIGRDRSAGFASLVRRAAGERARYWRRTLLGEQAVVADAIEAVRQHVDEEALMNSSVASVIRL